MQIRLAGRPRCLRVLPLCVATLVAVCSLPAQAASGPLSGQTTITEPAPQPGDFMGIGGGQNAVALSADGLTTLISVTDAKIDGYDGAGRVYVYHFAAGQWTLGETIDDPDPANDLEFGDALALDADGTVALIGSPSAVSGHANAGKAYLFTLSGGQWSKTHAFDDPPATFGDFFSDTSVALSADGKTAVIGAYFTTVSGHGGAGEGYIYQQSGGNWNLVASIPNPNPGSFMSDNFGMAVAVSGDGKSALFSGDDTAFLYTLSGGIWTQTHEFDDPDLNTGNEFSGSLALSHDGLTAVLADPVLPVVGSSVSGKAYIFHFSGGSWNLAHAFANPDHGSLGAFGYPLTVSADGLSVLIGSRPTVSGHPDAGKAYYYTLSKGSWSLAKTLVDPSPANNDRFGSSGVALSGDGSVAFIDASGKAVNKPQGIYGKAYVYQPASDLSSGGSSGGGSSGGGGGGSSGGYSSGGGGGTLDILLVLVLLGVHRHRSGKRWSPSH